MSAGVPTVTVWVHVFIILHVCVCVSSRRVIRAASELYKKSLTVKTIVQTPRFQRCSTAACVVRADWTGALERGRETSGSPRPVAAHLPPPLHLPTAPFVRKKGFEHQRAALLPRRQKQLVRDLEREWNGGVGFACKLQMDRDSFWRGFRCGFEVGVA